jgi:hypothetical protein
LICLGRGGTWRDTEERDERDERDEMGREDIKIERT